MSTKEEKEKILKISYELEIEKLRAADGLEYEK